MRIVSSVLLCIVCKQFGRFLEYHHHSRRDLQRTITARLNEYDVQQLARDGPAMSSAAAASAREEAAAAKAIEVAAAAACLKVAVMRRGMIVVCT